MNNKSNKPKALTTEEQAQVIYRQYAQKFTTYMEAAVFNLLGNSKSLELGTYDDIIKDGAEIAEKMIDEVPKAMNAAFKRRVERAEAAAAAAGAKS